MTFKWDDSREEIKSNTRWELAHITTSHQGYCLQFDGIHLHTMTNTAVTQTQSDSIHWGGRLDVWPSQSKLKDASHTTT